MGFYQIYKYRFQFIRTDTAHLLGLPTQWFIRFFNSRPTLLYLRERALRRPCPTLPVICAKPSKLYKWSLRLVRKICRHMTHGRIARIGHGVPCLNCPECFFPKFLSG